MKLIKVLLSLVAAALPLAALPYYCLCLLGRGGGVVEDDDDKKW